MNRKAGTAVAFASVLLAAFQAPQSSIDDIGKKDIPTNVGDLKSVFGLPRSRALTTQDVQTLERLCAATAVLQATAPARRVDKTIILVRQSAKKQSGSGRGRLISAIPGNGRISFEILKFHRRYEITSYQATLSQQGIAFQAEHSRKKARTTATQNEAGVVVIAFDRAKSFPHFFNGKDSPALRRSLQVMQNAYKECLGGPRPL